MQSGIPSSPKIFSGLPSSLQFIQTASPSANNGECNAAVSAQADIKVGSWGSGNVKKPQVLDALYQLQDLVLQDYNHKQFYVYSGGVIVSACFVSALIKDASQSGVANRKSVEYYGTESNKAEYRMSITVDTTSNIAELEYDMD
ncbi:hypothetical protein IW138_003912 [Coemansia sp. RSA 986]|nr:hypothetical protein LPJ74_004638 [Coemansia sp. RSA 1843]KAJ2088840.1 hypothetical protein IW138_003912 [Coemansia sp. RSA 986]